MDVTGLFTVLDDGGKPLLSVAGLTVHITDLDIKVHGGASYVFQR
jgi:hypothetical protein